MDEAFINEVENDNSFGREALSDYVNSLYGDDFVTVEFNRTKDKPITFDDRLKSKQFPDYVTENLYYFGITPNLKGFNYLRDAISLCLVNDDMIRNVTKKLYPTVAKINNTSSANVERNIRNAIGYAYKNGGLLNINQYVNIVVYKMDFKVTNSEFISVIVEKIKLDLLEDAFKQFKKDKKDAKYEDEEY